MRPLDCLTVMTVEPAVAAQFATHQLAGLGARVITIERGDGAHRYDGTVYGQSGYFVWLNPSRHRVGPDIKHPAGRQIRYDTMLARADVCVQNLAPAGAADHHAWRRDAHGTCGPPRTSTPTPCWQDPATTPTPSAHCARDGVI